MYLEFISKSDGLQGRSELSMGEIVQQNPSIPDVFVYKVQTFLLFRRVN